MSDNHKKTSDIEVSFRVMIRSISRQNEQPSPFQNLRRQPVPMDYGLRVIELAKVIDSKMETFREMVVQLRDRHFPRDDAKGAQPDTLAKLAAEAGYEDDYNKLLDQVVTLPGPKFPRAIASDFKMSTDDFESILWMFEPASAPASDTA